jgi:hypothetical protein
MDTLTRKLKETYDSVMGQRGTVAFFVATTVAALLSEFHDFIGAPALGPGWLVFYSLLTGALGVATNLAFSRPSTRRRPDARSVQRALARSLPPRRSAPRFTQFTGRQNELNEWLAAHDRLRELRREDQGPIVLAIHGPAGVGKSAFAMELARRLAEKYPDGVFAVSFGTGGTARGPADIARDLLVQLGWPNKTGEMPHTAPDRVALLRSITRTKRMLFVFDAARDHDQVRQVMPAGSGCAVIVVSRREIGSSMGYPARPPLPRPSLHDCLEIYQAIRDTPWIRDAELAVEVIQHCDRLPLAIRAAAEQARDVGDLRFLAELLRETDTRLGALDYGGRKIGERLESEFLRLPRRLRHAITHLAWLDSESFVPWVLRPLMGLPQHESTGIVASLEAIQLIERMGDDPTGQRRYRVNPLARLYARAHAPDDLQKRDIETARTLLDAAYLDLIDDVLAVRGEGYTHVRGHRTPHGRTSRSDIANVIAPNLDEIVRLEYLNLVRIIQEASEEHAGLVWRVASMLDGRVPMLTGSHQVKRIEEAFAKAGSAAARLDQPPLATVDVLLAHAQFLISLERYTEAHELVAQAEKKLIGNDFEVRWRRLRAKRVWAWACVQATANSKARAALDAAEAAWQELPELQRDDPRVSYDIHLIQVLSRESHRTPISTHPHAATRGNDISNVYSGLQSSELARQRGQWLGAELPLIGLLTRDGDARSRATALYRMARLKLDQAYDANNTGTADSRKLSLVLSQEAVEFAADCVFTYDAVHDTAGWLRARCLLMRTLVFARRLVAAGQLGMEIESDLAEYQHDHAGDMGIEPLLARSTRAHGELEKARGNDAEAWRLLSASAKHYRKVKDWTNHASVWRVLEGEENDGHTPIA